MKKIINYWETFINLNYDPCIIRQCRRKMDRDNLHTAKQVSCLLILILLILTFFYLTYDNNPVRNGVCVMSVLFMCAVFAISRGMLCDQIKITSRRTDMLLDVFSLICFLVAIYLGTFAAGDEMAVPSVWMFFFIILIFNRLPMKNCFVTLIAMAIFGVCSYITKRPYIFRYDIMHAFTSVIAALCMSWEKSRMKVENSIHLMRLEDDNTVIRRTVEEQEREAIVLRQKAIVDELTGLYKKNAFYENVKEILSKSDGSCMHVLVCVDVDDFKDINDKYGHLYGDRTLKEVAAVISREIGQDNMAGRFGGDEFLIFFPYVKEKEDVQKHMKRIIYTLMKPHVLEGKEIRISLSAGSACYPNCGITYNEIFEKADTALYKAKKAGKGCCICVDE